MVGSQGVELIVVKVVEVCDKLLEFRQNIEVWPASAIKKDQFVDLRGIAPSTREGLLLDAELGRLDPRQGQWTCINCASFK